MPSLNRLAGGGVLAAAAVLSATACSSSSSSTSALAGLSPDQIVQKSVADLKAASSVRITGQVVNSGQTITLDLTDVAAKGCQGTIGLAAPATSSSKAVSGTANIIEVDSTVYMKLSDSFFTSAGLPASEFSQVSGKYIKLDVRIQPGHFRPALQSVDPVDRLLQGGHRLRQGRNGDRQRPAHAGI